MHGRHKDRKGVKLSVGRTLNFMETFRVARSEIVIYRGESGMTFKQFQTLKVGELVQQLPPAYQSRFGTVGVVAEKKGKNELKVAFGSKMQWATRQQMILFTQEQS